MSSLNDEDRANLVAYLDGELDEAAAQALEAKLQGDPQARAEADALRRAWGLLDYLPRAEPSSTFTNRTLERLTLERKPRAGSTQRAPRLRRFPWLLLGSAAGIVLALGTGLALGTYLGRPGPGASDVDDETLMRHLRVVEKWRVYQRVDDLDFVQELARPDLFGEEPGS